MKFVLICTTAVLLIACTTPPPPPKRACPPLPQLPANASRLEGRVHWLTVIALYEQCASQP